MCRDLHPSKCAALKAKMPNADSKTYEWNYAYRPNHVIIANTCDLLARAFITTLIKGEKNSLAQEQPGGRTPTDFIVLFWGSIRSKPEQIGYREQKTVRTLSQRVEILNGVGRYDFWYNLSDSKIRNSFKGAVTQKLNFCYLLSFKLFQTWMTLFLQRNTKEIYF